MLCQLAFCDAVKLRCFLLFLGVCFLCCACSCLLSHMYLAVQVDVLNLLFSCSFAMLDLLLVRFNMPFGCAQLFQPAVYLLLLLLLACH